MPKDAKVICPKKRCCRDQPRCKRCPVVCKRLMKQGYAERLDDGRYVLALSLSKKQRNAARA
jgi:hypothetical protein